MRNKQILLLTLGAYMIVNMIPTIVFADTNTSEHLGAQEIQIAGVIEADSIDLNHTNASYANESYLDGELTYSVQEVKDNIVDEFFTISWGSGMETPTLDVHKDNIDAIISSKTDYDKLNIKVSAGEYTRDAKTFYDLHKKVLVGEPTSYSGNFGLAKEDMKNENNYGMFIFDDNVNTGDELILNIVSNDISSKFLTYTTVTAIVEEKLVAEGESYKRVDFKFKEDINNKTFFVIRATKRDKVFSIGRYVLLVSLASLVSIIGGCYFIRKRKK